MAIIQGNAKQGSTRGFYPRVINGSLRFNDDDSAYLSWTPASAGNRKTWTWSGWVKRGNLSGVIQGIFDGSSSSQVKTFIRFTSSDTLEIGSYNAGFQSQLVTSQVFRDPSAWYHIVVVTDTTQATSSNRVKLYVNGQQITAFSTETYPSQNFDTYVNATSTHTLGAEVWTSIQEYLDGYLAEVHFTDGTAYTADAFGELKNGVWVAKDPSVTYGTNGFYLNFQDDTAVEAFNTVLYKGTNGVGGSVTGVGFKPDLIWVKSRSAVRSHVISDSVRGTNANLFPDLTNAESTASTGIQSFDSDGFTYGTTAPLSDGDLVAWCWKAGDSNVSNTDGSITSTVRANDTYGFSIVSYTGNQTSGATVGHGLASAPDMIIVKNRDSGTDGWPVYHSSMDATNPEQYWMRLNDTNASTASSSYWNDTAPSSSIVTLGSSGWVNGNSQKMIMYCWAEKTGYSKFGSYTGNGSTTGPVITCGFEPALVIIKPTSQVDNWLMYDNTREVTNPKNKHLRPNSSAAEASLYGDIDFLSNGFQPKTTDSAQNGSGVTYIYAAFADTREAAFWLDQSGNDNDWQPVNLDHNDTVSDSPTNNFCTMNPLAIGDGIRGTFSEGNLKVDLGTPITTVTRNYGTMAIPSSGQYYFEGTFSDVSGGPRIGISVYRETGNQSRYVYVSSGLKIVGTSASSYGDAYAAGDTIGVAVDVDASTIEFTKNGTSQGSFAIDLTASTGSSSSDYFPFVANGSGASASVVEFNFGQQPFKYDPPA